MPRLLARLLLPSFFLSLGLASVALGEQTPEDQVFYDQNGMPRCIRSASSRGGDLFLTWPDRNGYRRSEIYVTDSLSIASATSMGMLLGSREDSFGYPCERLERVIPLVGGLVWSSPFSKFEKLALAPAERARLNEALAAVRAGANIHFAGLTPARWLQSNHVTDYTKELNEHLSRLHGQDFAADVFRLWLEAREPNRLLKADIERHARQGVDTRALVASLGNPLVLVGAGYLENPRESRVKVFVEDVRAAGFEVRMLSARSTDSLGENSRKNAEEIARELRAGRNIIMAAASKGAGEVLSALTELPTPRPGPGRLLGVLTLSGTLRGSFLVDFLDDFGGTTLAWALVKFAANSDDIPIGDIKPGFLSQGSRVMTEHFRPRAHLLPKDIPYVSVVGVLGSASERSGFVADIQGLLETNLFPDHAANDGFLIYPAMTLPREWEIPHRYEVVFEASHALMDGSFAGASLKDPEWRRRVIAGLLAAFAARIQPK